ncbi:hypothetical protein BDN71DRAFT_1433661 [Pleurotus eryngii]|uniref:Uncharacterized protein n=1 Tax=Pleurotus eryngii TaxID=5323 RepID=A0A9P6DDX8_PLEER|nr:hypothetical protein BDN71DRAFT_1433661 [Pleurotus eryngii]
MPLHLGRSAFAGAVGPFPYIEAPKCEASLKLTNHRHHTEISDQINTNLSPTIASSPMLNGARQRATGSGGVTGGARRDANADEEEAVMLAFCSKLFLVITSARTTIIEPYIPDLVENSFEMENVIPARLDRQRSESSGLLPLSTTMSEKMLNPERLIPTSTHELCIETFLVFPPELTRSESICKILEDPLLSTIFMQTRLDYTKRCILIEEHILTFEPAKASNPAHDQGARSGPSLFGPPTKVSHKEQGAAFFRGIYHYLDSLPAARLSLRLKQYCRNLNVNILVSVRDGTREDVLGFDDDVLDPRHPRESYVGYSPPMTFRQPRGIYALSSRYLQDPMKLYKQIHRLLFSTVHELNPKPPAHLSIGFWMWPLHRPRPRCITTSSNESDSESLSTPGGDRGRRPSRRRLPFLRRSRSLRSLKEFKSSPSPPPSAPLTDNEGRSSPTRKEKDRAIGRYGLEVLRRSNKGTRYLRQALEVRSLWTGTPTTDLTNVLQHNEPNEPSGRGGTNESDGGEFGGPNEPLLASPTEQDEPLRRSMIFDIRRSSLDSAVSIILQFHQEFSKRRSDSSFTSTAMASSVYTRPSYEYNHTRSPSIAELFNEGTYDFEGRRQPDTKHRYTPSVLGYPDPSSAFVAEETASRPPSPYRLSSSSSTTTGTYVTAKSRISSSIIVPNHTSINFSLPFSALAGDSSTMSRDVHNDTTKPIPPMTPTPANITPTNITPTGTSHHAGILTNEDRQNYLYHLDRNHLNPAIYNINFIFQGDTFSAPIYGGVVGGRSNNNLHSAALQASTLETRMGSRSEAAPGQIEAILAQIRNHEPTVHRQHPTASQPQSQA